MDGPTGATGPEAPCFAAGTLILTTAGERPVDDLAVGDEVVTASGRAAPIRWIGRRRVEIGRHPHPERVRPIRIAAHTFGPGQPRRDLYLSPAHMVFVDGVLIPALHLVDGESIAPAAKGTALHAAVTYVHVELDRHDVVLAEGLPAESFLDCNNRTDFENHAGPVTLYPDFAALTFEAACAPVVVGGPILDRVLARLKERAQEAAPSRLRKALAAVLRRAG